ncbi:MAG: leucine-rich repeat domain-containing protein, partial [Mycoplasmataceae bacterium]|nr:leucine-rich repeat domain-containing protein [Mycoplasmataceae bacterium]
GSAVTSIGKEAFYECTGLTGTLNIPDSVTTIGQDSFKYCNFNNVNVSSSNNHYGLATNVGDAHILVAKNGDQCLKNYGSNDIIGKIAFGTLTIPDSEDVTLIGEGAFGGCSGLTGTLTIPSRVTSIGEGAFRECSFNEVVNNSSIFSLINSAGITADKLSQTNPGFMLTTLDIPQDGDVDMNIKNIVFACGDDITIPSNINGHKVISIGDPNSKDFDDGYIAFAGSNMEKLDSNLVNEIYGRSFYNCRYLTKADFPNVKKIYDSAFENTKNLRKISLPKIEAISAEAFEFDNSINWVEIDASRNPEAEGMNIEQIFGEHNSSANGKLHNTSSDGTYKEQWLNKLCGGGDHHGWKWDN